MICPSCGKENQEGVKFCRYCGGALEAAQPQQQVPPQQFQQQVPPGQNYQQPPVQVQPGGADMIQPKNVSPFVAAFLNFLLGVGYFYIGQHLKGVVVIIQVGCSETFNIIRRYS